MSNVYQIELTRTDIDLITKALRVYESEPSHRDMFTAVMATVLTGKAPSKTETEQAIAKVQGEVAQRQNETILLMARLHEAVIRGAEFAKK